MKPLIVLVYTSADTPLDTIHTVFGQMPQVQPAYCHTEQDLTQALTAQSFDLLVIDLNLPREPYRKAQKLCELLYPDAAYTELDLQHAPFVDFKIQQLLQKWNDAHDEAAPRIWDGLL